MKMPKYVKPFLWSYDIKKLDKKEHKKRIITNVLNFGTSQATEWLFKQYNKKEIKEVVADPLPGEWNAKSLNLWSIVFDVKSKITKRKIRL